MEAIEAIKKRRSVRNFTGEALPKADIETIVDAGRLAASGMNLQPWDFIAITDREKISQLEADTECTKMSAIIAVVMDPVSRWWVEDGAAAVQNMLVACTALGYGGCWLEGYTQLREQELKALLGIPLRKRLLTIVPLGVPVELPEKEKKPLSQVLHWEKYA